MNNGKVKKTLVKDFGPGTGVYVFKLVTVNGVTFGVYVNGTCEWETSDLDKAIDFAKKFV